MKKTYTFQRSSEYDELRWTRNREVWLCPDGLEDAFDLPEGYRVVDVVVQTTKPRGEDYHVIIRESEYGFPVIQYDDGEYELFASVVDDELYKFDADTLYVSVYA